METKTLNISQIEPNNGQLKGIPRNPRKWSTRELDKLKRSLIETPELAEVRPPLVAKKGETYICIGGNMRLEALKEAGKEEVVCAVLPKGLGTKTIKEIAIKDNSNFGAWDMDALANEWSVYPLADWGLPVYDMPEETHDADAQPVDDRDTIEIKLSPDEFNFVSQKLHAIAPSAEEAVLKLLNL